MNFKELVRIINRLDQTEHNFDVYGEILVISYYIGIKDIVARIDFRNSVYRFDIRLNENNDIELDLTEENGLIKQIGKELYKKIINKILREEI